MMFNHKIHEKWYGLESGGFSILKSSNSTGYDHFVDVSKMVDVAFDDQVLFKKLCRNYYATDPKAATFYVNSYREMWEDDKLEENRI